LRRVSLSLFLCMPALWCQHRVSISNIQATNIGSYSATIQWTTSVPANSMIYYGETTSYTNAASDSALVTQHSLTLSNLSPSTIYDYRVQSTGTHSSASSGNNTFQTSSGSTTPAPNDLWAEIASDMTGHNEGAPHGVPSSYDWAQGPTLTMGNNPNGWKAMTAWGVVYEAAEGNPATNTRVNIRDLQLFFLQKSTGKWLLLQNTNQPEGAAYLEDFSGDTSKPGDVRQESDGTISVTAGGGYNFHFYPSDRASINPNDVGGILVLLQARLIVGNPSLPDDRSIARYLSASGADYYPALTGGWPGNLSYNPGVGTGKMKYVQSEWRFFAMTTLTADQLSSNPPPVNLTGIMP
jgi:hypothetical protein